MKVGGRSFEYDRKDVETVMRTKTPDAAQKYVVEVDGVLFPPKQVLAAVTGWERTSFTTMEAQRVLGKLGFASREVGQEVLGSRGSRRERNEAPVDDDSVLARLAAAEAALVTAQEAIANISARVRVLEAR